MQKPLMVTCRASDIRRIKISCRCGTISIAEVPQQIARALNLHPCPGCSAGFSVSQDLAGKWVVNRVTESVADMVVSPAMGEEEKHEQCYGVGSRIRIVDGTTKRVQVLDGFRAVNPHPEHVGKFGTIIGEENVGNGYSTPKIRLDDGTLLTGAECWWEPVKM